MKRTILAIVAALALSSAVVAAQDATAAKPAPTLTAEQVLDKYVAATGGRDAYLKHKSLATKGTVQVAGAGLTGLVESYSVAPNRFATAMVIGGYGTIRQVFDGTKGWEANSLSGVRELSGSELALLARQATFNADAEWRELWKAVELVGTQQVGDRTAYAVRLTPHPGGGNPMTNLYDAETFLLLRTETVLESESGKVPLVATLSDYRDVGGVKLPFKSELQAAGVTLGITLTEATFDVKVDETHFAKPQ